MGHPNLWKAYEVTGCLPTLLRLRGSLVCWVRGSQAGSFEVLAGCPTFRPASRS